MRQAELKISAIWAAHFLLWTFGDMLGLLQENSAPVDDRLLLFVAAPLGIFQCALIIVPFFFTRKPVRILNFVLLPIYFFFNIGNFFDVGAGWGFLLTVCYIAMNLLTFFVIIKWSKDS